MFWENQGCSAEVVIRSAINLTNKRTLQCNFVLSSRCYGKGCETFGHLTKVLTFSLINSAKYART